MAILYTLTISDPNNAGYFPPSFLQSGTQGEKLSQYLLTKSVLRDEGGVYGLIFGSESDLNAWLSEYSITDTALKAELATWKSTHGVSYTSNYYSLPSAGITPTNPI
jgi:hypothetical protein